MLKQKVTINDHGYIFLRKHIPFSDILESNQTPNNSTNHGIETIIIIIYQCCLMSKTLAHKKNTWCEPFLLQNATIYSNGDWTR